MMSNVESIGIGTYFNLVLFTAIAIAQTHHQRRRDHESLGSTQQKCIYLDFNGTTPVYEPVLQAMLPFLTTHFGNPSSAHLYGQTPKQAILDARVEIAKLLRITRHNNDDSMLSEQIVFTGCGTEADNLAILLALSSSMFPKKHVITTNVEHPAVLEYLRHLEYNSNSSNVTVTYVPVNEYGTIKVEDVLRAIRPGETCLVTIMLANNESGALMPVAEIAAECRTRNILFHTDAAQAVGKVSIDVDKSLGGADMVTIVGHKFGAPKGIAALYIRYNCLTHNENTTTNFGKSGVLTFGGGQEGGIRPGTENVAYIVGLGKAAALLSCNDTWKENALHMERCRNQMIKKLHENLNGLVEYRINGPVEATERLPNTLNISFKQISASELLHSIKDIVAVSAGSACHANEKDKPSSVLLAMNIPQNFIKGTIRISFGPSTKIRDINDAARILASEIHKQLLIHS